MVGLNRSTVLKERLSGVEGCGQYLAEGLSGVQIWLQMMKWTKRDQLKCYPLRRGLPLHPGFPTQTFHKNATSPGVVKKLFPVSSIALSAVEQSPLPTSSTASLEPVLRSLSQKRQERQADARSTEHGLQNVFLSIIPTHWDQNIELVSILKTTSRSAWLFKSWIVTWTSNLKSCKDKIFQLRA